MKISQLGLTHEQVHSLASFQSDCAKTPELKKIQELAKSIFYRLEKPLETSGVELGFFRRGVYHLSARFFPLFTTFYVADTCRIVAALAKQALANEQSSKVETPKNLQIKDKQELKGVAVVNHPLRPQESNDEEQLPILPPKVTLEKLIADEVIEKLDDFNKDEQELLRFANQITAPVTAAKIDSKQSFSKELPALTEYQFYQDIADKKGSYQTVSLPLLNVLLYLEGGKLDSQTAKKWGALQDQMNAAWTEVGPYKQTFDQSKIEWNEFETVLAQYTKYLKLVFGEQILQAANLKTFYTELAKEKSQLHFAQIPKNATQDDIEVCLTPQIDKSARLIGTIVQGFSLVIKRALLNNNWAIFHFLNQIPGFVFTAASSALWLAKPIIRSQIQLLSETEIYEEDYQKGKISQENWQFLQTKLRKKFDTKRVGFFQEICRDLIGKMIDYHNTASLLQFLHASKSFYEKGKNPKVDCQTKIHMGQALIAQFSALIVEFAKTVLQHPHYLEVSQAVLQAGRSEESPVGDLIAFGQQLSNDVAAVKH